jgi:hypothetical protein
MRITQNNEKSISVRQSPKVVRRRLLAALAPDWTLSRGKHFLILGGIFLMALAATIVNVEETPAQSPESGNVVRCRLPTIAENHSHVRALIDNAMRYVDPKHGTIDPFSGYPVEGWNDEPEKQLALRSFTQLTAIGEWIDLLANILAGHLDTPDIPREQALAQLKLAVDTLRQDQQDPTLASQGLLVNFMDLASGKRLAPLGHEIDKSAFSSAFSGEKGDAIWLALQAKGWLSVRRDGTTADIKRSAEYGAAFFTGPLAPFADDPTKQQIMGLLDRRVVAVMFGDNANLTISVARAIGALLSINAADERLADIRQEMERFLDDQREGYAHLYDAGERKFCFGWNATSNRFVGWQDDKGNFCKGYMDYLINEFRGPTKFVVLRYGLPHDAIKNLGFKIKPYRNSEHGDTYVLAPWDGSAFQALGLGLCMGELQDPSWRRLLENVVDVELDYSTRNRLPGFLSESYTGNGAQYTGEVGIPDIAVTASPRITSAASLYTLGIAYMISPGKIEQFLAKNWSEISKLLTDHGPWEGCNLQKQETISVQTSGHTFSLILGLLGTGPENMRIYLASKGIGATLGEIYKPGGNVDFLSSENGAFAWGNDGANVKTTRSPEGFQVKTEKAERIGIAFVPKQNLGVDLSGGILSIGYRCGAPLDRIKVCFKPLEEPPVNGVIPNELIMQLESTNGHPAEVQIPLPATPGLMGIKEIVITSEQLSEIDVDLTITRMAFASNPK